ncbi:MAG: hypothetical protein M5T61_19520 [Acidimicrobiia bacterium]|nr:hypothetical protein [Acidimicrobiia bacterium]
MTGARAAFDDLSAVRDPGAAAGMAAEALRAVNRLTIAAPSPGTPGWKEVGDLYRVLGELCLVVDRLPQAVDQLRRHLERSAAAGRFRADAGTRDNPERLVASAAASLGAAQADARQVGSQLAAAHSAVAHLAPAHSHRRA